MNRGLMLVDAHMHWKLSQAAYAPLWSSLSGLLLPPHYVGLCLLDESISFLASFGTLVFKFQRDTVQFSRDEEPVLLTRYLAGIQSFLYLQTPWKKQLKNMTNAKEHWSGKVYTIPLPTRIDKIELDPPTLTCQQEQLSIHWANVKGLHPHIDVHQGPFPLSDKKSAFGWS